MSSEINKKLRNNIKRMYLFRFFMYFHLIAGVLVPFFTIWGGIKFHQVMILQACFTFFTFALEIPTGVIADRFGLKTSLVLSGLVGVVAALVYSSYPNFWIFLIAEFFWASGVAFASGADQALVYDSLKDLSREKESKKIFGRLGSMIPLPLIIAAPLGSLIAKEWGLRATVQLMAIPMFLAAVVAMTLTEPKTKIAHEEKQYLKILKTGVKFFKSHKELKILAFDYIFISALSFLIIWLNQVVLQSMGVAIEWFGVIFAAMFVLEMVLMNSFTILERALGGKRRYTLLSALIPGFACIAIGLFINIWVSIAGIILMGGFGLSRMTLMQNYMNKFIESGRRATIISTVSMFLSLTQTVTRLTTGYMTEWNLQITLFAIGGLIIVFAIRSSIKEEHLLD